MRGNQSTVGRRGERTPRRVGGGQRIFYKLCCGGQTVWWRARSIRGELCNVRWGLSLSCEENSGGPDVLYLRRRISHVMAPPDPGRDEWTAYVPKVQRCNLLYEDERNCKLRLTFFSTAPSQTLPWRENNCCWTLFVLRLIKNLTMLLLISLCSHLDVGRVHAREEQ